MASAIFNAINEQQAAATAAARTQFDYAQYQRQYRKGNPERVKRWRLNQAVSLLRRNGYQVTPLETPAEAAEAGEGGAGE